MNVEKELKEEVAKLQKVIAVERKKNKIAKERLRGCEHALKSLEKENYEISRKLHGIVSIEICTAVLLKKAICAMTWWKRKSFCNEYDKSIDEIEDLMNTSMFKTHPTFKKVEKYL